METVRQKLKRALATGECFNNRKGRIRNKRIAVEVLVVGLYGCGGGQPSKDTGQTEVCSRGWGKEWDSQPTGRLSWDLGKPAIY